MTRLKTMIICAIKTKYTDNLGHGSLTADLRKVTGELVLKCVCKVLQQFGLRMEHNAGAVTDAGTDIKGAFGKAFKWEWCLPATPF